MAVFNLGYTIPVSKLLFPKLAKEIKNLRAGGVTRRAVAESKIFSIIKDELNLNISCNYEQGMASAYIAMPLLNEDHPFLKRYVASVASGDAIALINKYNGVVEGGFDSQGKATGIFAELTTNMVITSGLFDSKFTDENVAAVICHEIGHYRTSLSALKYAFTTSHLIRTTVEAFLDNKNREERTRLVLALENATGTTINSREKVVDSNDNELITTVIVGAATSVKSELNTNAFDVSQCEQAADQFAVACGAELELIDALNKISWYFTPSRIPRPLYYLFEIAGLVKYFFLAHIPIGAIMIAAKFILTGNPLATTYNKTEERMRRVRQAAVVESKAPWLTKEQRKSIAARIKDMDEIIALHKDRPSIFELFFTLLVPSGRSNAKNTDIVRLYEELTSNELHVSVNKLKSIG